jgi:hypothetical protein
MSTSDPAVVRSSVSSGLDQRPESHGAARRDTRVSRFQGSVDQPHGPPDSRGWQLRRACGSKRRRSSRGGIERSAPHTKSCTLRSREPPLPVSNREPSRRVIQGVDMRSAPCIRGGERRCSEHRAGCGASLLRLRPARCVWGDALRAGQRRYLRSEDVHVGLKAGSSDAAATTSVIAQRRHPQRPEAWVEAMLVSGDM